MALNTTEQGVTGVAIWNGRPTERYLSSLQGSAGIEKFAEMLRKEPSAFTANRLVELTARQAKWNVIPADDTPADRDAAEFLKSCINDMSHSFDIAVIDALSAQWYGFSLAEIVWKRRNGRKINQGGVTSAYNDGLVGIRKLAIRRQETVNEWLLDANGGVQGVKQRDPVSSREITIPIDKMLHFIVIHDRGNPEGLALAEVVYKTWHQLENYEILDGVSAERAFIGLPVFSWLQEPQPSDQAAVEALGRGLALNEQAYVSLPGTMVDFKLVSITNANADALRAKINVLRWEIVGVVFGNYIRLGTTDTGNRSLGETLVDAFTRGVDAVLKDIADVFNMHLVPRLFAANPSFKVEQYPRLQPSQVTKLPLSVLQYLTGMQEWFLAAPPEDNLWLRELLGMPYVPLKPEPPEPEVVEVPVAPEPEDAGETEDTPEDDTEDQDEGEDDGEEAQGQERQEVLTSDELALLNRVADELVKANTWLKETVDGTE